MIRRAVSRSVGLAVLVCAIAAPSIASAQAQGTRAPVANNHVLSANPFLLMFEYANFEFERKASQQTSFGFSASSVGFDDATYRNFQVFYRYYPQGASLTGFYIGARGGVHRVSNGEDAGHASGLGFELGYSWLFGAKRSFALSLGAGATRLFGGNLRHHSSTIPTLRLVNVGWSF